MNIDTIIRLLGAVGPIVARADEFKAMIDDAIGLFEDDDQARLEEAYQMAREGSAQAHARLQELVALHTA